MLGLNAGTLRNKMKKLGIIYGRRREKSGDSVSNY